MEKCERFLWQTLQVISLGLVMVLSACAWTTTPKKKAPPPPTYLRLLFTPYGYLPNTLQFNQLSLSGDTSVMWREQYNQLAIRFLKAGEKLDFTVDAGPLFEVGQFSLQLGGKHCAENLYQLERMTTYGPEHVCGPDVSVSLDGSKGGWMHVRLY